VKFAKPGHRMGQIYLPILYSCLDIARVLVLYEMGTLISAQILLCPDNADFTVFHKYYHFGYVLCDITECSTKADNVNNSESL